MVIAVSIGLVVLYGSMLLVMKEIKIKEIRALLKI